MTDRAQVEIMRPGGLYELTPPIHEAGELFSEVRHPDVLSELVGDSPSMRQLLSVIRQIAPTTASVLITGESGTGKELVARAIHRLSPRRHGPFVGVNCAALPESLMESELFGHERGSFTGALERRAGCFERAHGGTLLLDEIAEMPTGMQAKLLRVIEEGKVRRLGGASDVSLMLRIVAATNHSPQQAIQNKLLREDLYYRLNVFHISLPPLRERKPDIALITSALIRHINKKHGCSVTGISSEVLRQFEEYSWPGNVRELRNVVERAMILAQSGELRLHHLSIHLAPLCERPASPDGLLHIPVGAKIKEVEESYIRFVLNQTEHNRRRAAKILGISLHTLYNKLRIYRGTR